MKRAEVQKAFTFSGNRDCIYTLERDVTDAGFFSASGDGMVVRWNFNKPDEGELFAKVPNSVYSLALLKQKNQLLVGQNFSGIHVIDLETKSEIRNITLTSAAIFDLLICLDQVWIVDGAGTLFVLDVNDFKLLFTAGFSDKSARSVAFNPFEDEVAIGSSDNNIRIFDRKSFSLKRIIQAHANSVFTITYSPDGRYLISAGRDAHLKVWDVHQDYELKHDVAAHMFAINHLVFSPDGHYFASGSMDKTIKVWNAQTFELIKVIDKVRHAGHGTSINKLLWLPYHDYLISGSDDRNLSVWKVEFYEKQSLI